MELKIQRGPIIDADCRLPELIEKRPQLTQLIRSTSLCGEPGGFDLKADPKLHDRQRIGDDAKGRRVDEGSQRQGATAHKRPDTVACLNHSSSL
ncbi:hypothetical protein D9M69_523700 [compost metagenome]